MAQCSAHARSGQQCRQNAITGATVCRTHGGLAPQVKAKAAERVLEAKVLAALRRENIEPTSDPLRLIAELTGEAHKLAELLRDKVAELDHLHSWTEGGEQPRAIVALYERALDRVQKFAESMVRLNIDERMARLSEQHAEQIVRVIEGAIAELGLSNMPEARPVVERHLRMVSGS